MERSQLHGWNNTEAEASFHAKAHCSCHLAPVSQTRKENNVSRTLAGGCLSPRMKPPSTDDTGISKRQDLTAPALNDPQAKGDEDELLASILLQALGWGHSRHPGGVEGGRGVVTALLNYFAT